MIKNNINTTIGANPKQKKIEKVSSSRHHGPSVVDPTVRGGLLQVVV